MRIELGVGAGFLVPPPLSLATPMLRLRKIKQVFANFQRGFWRFQQNFNGSKNSAILEPRTGQFRGLEASKPRPKPRTSKCVLEANDVLKDSTFIDWYFGHFEVKGPINSPDANAVICYLREWFVNNAVCDYF